MLDGKTALVTGASRGIGRAIAIRLAASGAPVAVNYATDAAAGMLSDPAMLDALTAQTALRRPYGEPEEIAELVHALAGPDTGWVTGQIIQANGGFKL